VIELLGFCSNESFGPSQEVYRRFPIRTAYDRDYADPVKDAYERKEELGQIHIGVSITQLLTNRIPIPTMLIERGMEISFDKMTRLQRGETADLREGTHVVSLLLMDEEGILREKRYPPCH